MTQNTRTSLVVLQTLIAVLTLLMFAAGAFGIRVTEKTEEQLRKSSDVSFDNRMRPLIGKTYSEERHYKLLEVMRTSDAVNTSSKATLTAASELMLNLGGLLALSALTSIFLLLKKPRSGNQPEQASHPPPLP